MSSERAVRVKDLGKRYRLGGSPYKTLRETLASLPSRLALRTSKTSEEAHRLWALEDVSFDVTPGEAVGIIGANGAGKSTLLKILSRITRPTTGYAELRGRVGSLLEVGTGFHPELTGRENIYLNGVILGLRRRDIRSRFDEIVEFSGIGQEFLDTPLKRYSSGMAMRLAFSVAAHLDTEILVIDEVLAVGDAEFQDRCLGKMDEVAHGGRTVLFVSHNMAAVERLCQRVLVLRGGRLVLDGPTEGGVRHYLQRSASTEDAGEEDGALAAEHSKLVSWDFSQPAGGPLRPLQPACLRFRVEATKVLSRPSLMFQLMSSRGSLLWSLDYQDLDRPVSKCPAGSSLTYEFRVDSLPLNPGHYPLQVWLKNRANEEFTPLQRLIELVVDEGPVYGQRSAAELRRWYGPMAVLADVSCSPREASTGPSPEGGDDP